MATRAILYRRVSTREQGLGLAAQLERLDAEAERRGWSVEHVTDEGVSGSVDADKRPDLGPALASLGPGDVLAVAKIDRLSRSVLDLARLLARAENEGWSIVVLDLGVDTTTANGSAGPGSVPEAARSATRPPARRRCPTGRDPRQRARGHPRPERRRQVAPRDRRTAQRVRAPVASGEAVAPRVRPQNSVAPRADSRLPVGGDDGGAPGPYRAKAPSRWSRRLRTARALPALRRPRHPGIQRGIRSRHVPSTS